MIVLCCGFVRVSERIYQFNWFRPNIDPRMNKGRAKNTMTSSWSQACCAINRIDPSHLVDGNSRTEVRQNMVGSRT